MHRLLFIKTKFEDTIMQEYTTIRARATGEIVEKRSRFIGEIFPVQSEEEALRFLAQVKAQHRCGKATLPAILTTANRRAQGAFQFCKCWNGRALPMYWLW